MSTSQDDNRESIFFFKLEADVLVLSWKDVVLALLHLGSQLVAWCSREAY